MGARPPRRTARRAVSTRPVRAFFGMIVLVWGCAQGTEPRLATVAPQTARVGEILRVPLRVEGGQGRDFGFRFQGPPLSGIDRTASIAGTGDGGLFSWSPLPAHIGVHEFSIELLSSGGSRVDRKSLVVDVRASADAAPVFLQPGPGRTYDLTESDCIVVPVEVRDADSPEVDIRTRLALPDGARLYPDSTSSKRAEIEWCPTRDQQDLATRWTLSLEATDFDHPPVPLDHVAVLRTELKQDCPGQPPDIFIVSPRQDERVVSPGGWPVVAGVSDDLGVREAPLLLYSTSEPANLDDPDVTRFEQVEFEPDGDRWRARIPPIDSGADSERDVYFMVSATDNDDENGAACDHRTDTPVRRFRAVTGDGAGDIPVCGTCTAPAECASGLCATVASGGRCVPHCDDTAPCDTGSCESRVMVDGAVASTCGPVSTVCEGQSGQCLDDSREDDDATGQATAYRAAVDDGQICEGDPDFFRIDAQTDERLTVVVDDFVHAEGDLDLQLLASDGTTLDTSAGVGDREEVTHCALMTRSVYARVYGFNGAQNRYALAVAREPGACRCTDDPREDDDTRQTARSTGIGQSFEGVICANDDDWLRFEIDAPIQIRAAIAFDHGEGDLDMTLHGPDGSERARSAGTNDYEDIVHDTQDSGTYWLRIYGYSGAGGSYDGQVEVNLQ